MRGRENTDKGRRRDTTDGDTLAACWMSGGLKNGSKPKAVYTYNLYNGCNPHFVTI